MQITGPVLYKNREAGGRTKAFLDKRTAECDAHYGNLCGIEYLQIAKEEQDISFLCDRCLERNRRKIADVRLREQELCGPCAFTLALPQDTVIPIPE